MTEKAQFVDFGAPEQFGTHVFRVEILSARTEPIRIIEDYGYRGLEDGIPRDEEAYDLPRPSGRHCRSARRAFNDRSRPPGSLSVAGMPASISWSVSRQELCVLAWAAETANDGRFRDLQQVGRAPPEERWWLFSMTVAEKACRRTQRGWRRALFFALSDGEKPPAQRKRRRPADADLVNLSLFEAIT
jgi:hypothetical protein